MMPVRPSPQALAASPEFPPPPPLHPAWASVVSALDALCDREALRPSAVVVLVPFAQLMGEARRAWAARHPQGWMPRFETTRNWAHTVAPFVPGPTDLGVDMARDAVIAGSLIDGVGRARPDAALRPELVARLVEAARQLAPLAAARPPEDRLAWAESVRPSFSAGTAFLHWEGLIDALALSWASTSGYATDALWSERAAPGVVAQRLVVLRGHQPDALGMALAQRWGERAQVLDLAAAAPSPATSPAPSAAVHEARDEADEAQRAAAVVLAHLHAGRAPVALVANDRVLTRRAVAQLVGEGVAVRDETGWKLSTTRSAARVMALLRAADPNAGVDDVLDALSGLGAAAAAWDEAAARALERAVRQAGVARWRAAARHPGVAPCVPAVWTSVQASLQPPRPLSRWVMDLSAALRTIGAWDPLVADAAGNAVVAALRLGEGAADELDALGPGTGTPRRWTLAAFTAWVRDVLEAGSFTPPVDGAPSVVVLPLAQLVGRAFGAVVAPGCDDRHLPASPEPPGGWSTSQREALGLPTRDTLAAAQRAAWLDLIARPTLDLMWRRADGGDACLPNPWLQSLGAPPAPDPRPGREVAWRGTPRPGPSAPDLLPRALSASAYDSLRTCPYRFFALRQLRLKAIDELDQAPDGRDLGTWIHAVLHAFHAERPDATSPDDDRARLDALAESQARALGLAGEDGQGPDFLPFRATWPALRDGYLAWLSAHENSPGAPRVAALETERRVTVGPWTLTGTLDRIDRAHHPTHGSHADGPIHWILDYKTERRDTTKSRVSPTAEDTQLPFYAALMPDERVRAAYLSLTDGRGTDEDEATKAFEPPDVDGARDALIAGVRHDLDRLAAGAATPALGEGRACERCDARGLCRRDFWA